MSEFESKLSALESCLNESEDYSYAEMRTALIDLLKVYLKENPDRKYDSHANEYIKLLQNHAFPMMFALKDMGELFPPNFMNRADVKTILELDLENAKAIFKRQQEAFIEKYKDYKFKAPLDTDKLRHAYHEMVTDYSTLIKSEIALFGNQIACLDIVEEYKSKLDNPDYVLGFFRQKGAGIIASQVQIASDEVLPYHKIFRGLMVQINNDNNPDFYEDKKSYDEVLTANLNKALLKEHLKYFRSIQIDPQAAANANPDLDAIRSIVKLIVGIKKFKRAQRGTPMDLELLQIGAEQDQGWRIARLWDMKVKGKSPILHKTQSIEDNLRKKIHDFARDDSSDVFRQQMIIELSAHHIPVEIEIRKLDNGTIQKRAIIMDAAQDLRAQDVKHILESPEFDFDVYEVGLPGQMIQFDGFSCPIFAIELLSKSSKDPDFFSKVIKVASNPDRTYAKRIAWEELGPTYFKMAQSRTFLAEQIKLMQQTDPDMLAKSISTKHGYTLEQYMQDQQRLLEAVVLMNKYYLFGQTEEKFSKVQNAATEFKLASYLDDIEALLKIVSDHDLTALLRGEPPKDLKLDNLPHHPAYQKDRPPAVKDLGTVDKRSRFF